MKLSRQETANSGGSGKTMYDNVADDDDEEEERGRRMMMRTMMLKIIMLRMMRYRKMMRWRVMKSMIMLRNMSWRMIIMGKMRRRRRMRKMKLRIVIYIYIKAQRGLGAHFRYVRYRAAMNSWNRSGRPQQNRKKENRRKANLWQEAFKKTTQAARRKKTKICKIQKKSQTAIVNIAATNPNTKQTDKTPRVWWPSVASGKGKMIPLTGWRRQPQSGKENSNPPWQRSHRQY